MLVFKNVGHSKVVAFILVMAMIFMYTFSFAGLAFASAVPVFTVSVSDITSNSASIGWEPSNPAASYEVLVTGGSYDSGTKIVSGLAPSTEYTATVTETLTISAIVNYPTEKDGDVVSWIDNNGGTHTTHPNDSRIVKPGGQENWTINVTEDTTSTQSASKTFTTLDAEIPRSTNLWVASDDYSEVYINGVSVTDNDPLGHYYSTVQEYIVDAAGTPFIAAQGWDTKQVIAGFKLVFMKDNDAGYLVTNNDWYYYTGSTTPPAFGGTQWYEEDYIGEGWSNAFSITDPHSAWTAQFPAAGANWIWSPNYKASTTIQTPVYLRSMPPDPIPTTGILTVEKNVVDNQEDISDNMVFEFYLDGNTETTYDFSELSPGSIELNTGSYVVHEAAKAGYTPENTTHAAIVTTAGAIVTFTNEKNDTPPPTTGTITVYKDVLTSTGGAVVDTTSNFAFSITDVVEDITSNFAFSIMDLDDFTTTFAITDGEHMTYTLPFGTYTVTETGYGDYTPQTTQTALTISPRTPTAMFTFENWQPGDTPPPQTGILTVNKNVMDNQEDIDDNTVFQFYLNGDDGMYNFSELSPGSIELPVGNYVVYEAAKTGYTPENTTHAAIVTTRGASVTFINEKNDPPEDGFDIEVQKTVDDSRVYRNQTVTFTVTVTNNGPDAAYEISVYDLIPQGLEVDSIQASEGTFNEGAWTIGTILSGESETLTIEAVVTAVVGTVITNTAGWDGRDNDPSNNEDSASTTVIRRSTNNDDDEIIEVPEELPPEAVVVVEEAPPLATLPKTGGFPAELFYSAGLALVAIGTKLRSKKDK